MAIGGFNGQGGNLSLAQFEAYVKAGDIHYFIVSSGGPGGGGGGAPGGGGFGEGAGRLFASGGGTGGRIAPSGFRGDGGGAAGGPGGASTISAITSWVEAHSKAETIGGQTVYDL
jgi:hypothetical protein